MVVFFYFLDLLTFAVEILVANYFLDSKLFPSECLALQDITKRA